MALFSVTIVATAELCAAISSRVSRLSKRIRALHGPEQFVFSFTSNLNSAVKCSIYPGRNVFEQAPALKSTEGDFVVLTKQDGTTLAYELTSGSLRISESAPGSSLRQRTYASNIQSSLPLCFLRNGTATLTFSASTDANFTTFKVSGRIPASR